MRAFFFLFPIFYLMSTAIPTHKLRPAYYSNHQEAIPIEAATYKQNKLLVISLAFTLSNLLAVVDKRGWHFELHPKTWTASIKTTPLGTGSGTPPGSVPSV